MKKTNYDDFVSQKLSVFQRKQEKNNEPDKQRHQFCLQQKKNSYFVMKVVE